MRDIMKKRNIHFHNNLTKIMILLSSFCLVSCGSRFLDKQEVGEHHYIEYIDQEINKTSFDKYLSTHQQEYPFYEQLKVNAPDVLNNVKVIDSSTHFDDNGDFLMFRFSSLGNGGFDSETFLCFQGDYYHLGGAFGGFGVTEFIRVQGNQGHYLYFISSSGSGIHYTSIGVFDLLKKETYTLDLSLKINEDYTFIYNDENHSIDLYKANIVHYVDEENYDLHIVTKLDLVKDHIERLDKVQNSSNFEKNSDGIYYGANHSLIQKDYKEPTCQEDGYVIIGCTECDDLDQKTILPKVDHQYGDDDLCIWCHTPKAK